MISNTKKKLGFWLRGIIGFMNNKTERIPAAPKGIPNFILGHSVNNQDITGYKVGDGPLKILFAGGIHGNEVGTIRLAYHLLQWLNNNQIINDYTIYVIPCLNPDGYQAAKQNPDYFRGGKIGRFNARNVDLNRNFPTPSFQRISAWSFGKDYSEKKQVYCGEHGNSEPETQALTEFIQKEGIRIFFMFHNAGKQVMGNNNPLSQKLTHIYCDKSGFRYINEQEWTNLHQTGTAKEWCDINDVAYVEVEGSTRWDSDWSNQKAAIEEILTNTLSSK